MMGRIWSKMPHILCIVPHTLHRTGNPTRVLCLKTAKGWNKYVSRTIIIWSVEYITTVRHHVERAYKSVDIIHPGISYHWPCYNMPHKTVVKSWFMTKWSRGACNSLDSHDNFTPLLKDMKWCVVYGYMTLTFFLGPVFLACHNIHP